MNVRNVIENPFLLFRTTSASTILPNDFWPPASVQQLPVRRFEIGKQIPAIATGEMLTTIHFLRDDCCLTNSDIKKLIDASVIVPESAENGLYRLLILRVFTWKKQEYTERTQLAFLILHGLARRYKNLLEICKTPDEVNTQFMTSLVLVNAGLHLMSRLVEVCNNHLQKSINMNNSHSQQQQQQQQTAAAAIIAKEQFVTVLSFLRKLTTFDFQHQGNLYGNIFFVQSWREEPNFLKLMAKYGCVAALDEFFDEFMPVSLHTAKFLNGTLALYADRPFYAIAEWLSYACQYGQTAFALRLIEKVRMFGSYLVDVNTAAVHEEDCVVKNIEPFAKYIVEQDRPYDLFRMICMHHHNIMTPIHICCKYNKLETLQALVNVLCQNYRPDLECFPYSLHRYLVYHRSRRFPCAEYFKRAVLCRKTQTTYMTPLAYATSKSGNPDMIHWFIRIFDNTSTTTINHSSSASTSDSTGASVGADNNCGMVQPTDELLCNPRQFLTKAIHGGSLPVIQCVLAHTANQIKWDVTSLEENRGFLEASLHAKSQEVFECVLRRFLEEYKNQQHVNHSLQVLLGTAVMKNHKCALELLEHYLPTINWARQGDLLYWLCMGGSYASRTSVPIVHDAFQQKNNSGFGAAASTAATNSYTTTTTTTAHHPPHYTRHRAVIAFLMQRLSPTAILKTRPHGGFGFTTPIDDAVDCGTVVFLFQQFDILRSMIMAKRLSGWVLFGKDDDDEKKEEEEKATSSCSSTNQQKAKPLVLKTCICQGFENNGIRALASMNISSRVLVYMHPFLNVPDDFDENDKHLIAGWKRQYILREKISALQTYMENSHHVSSSSSSSLSSSVTNHTTNTLAKPQNTNSIDISSTPFPISTTTTLLIQPSKDPRTRPTRTKTKTYTLRNKNEQVYMNKQKQEQQKQRTSLITTVILTQLFEQLTALEMKYPPPFPSCFQRNTSIGFYDRMYALVAGSFNFLSINAAYHKPKYTPPYHRHQPPFAT